TCRMSNTPWASTTLRPSARAFAPSNESSSIDLIFPSIVPVRPCAYIARLPWVAEIFEPVGRGVRDALRCPYWRIAPIFDRVQHLANTQLDRHGSRPAKFGLNAAGISERAIRLARAFWNVHLLVRLEQPHQAIDRDRIV